METTDSLLQNQNLVTEQRRFLNRLNWYIHINFHFFFVSLTFSILDNSFRKQFKNFTCIIVVCLFFLVLICVFVAIKFLFLFQLHFWIVEQWISNIKRRKEKEREKERVNLHLVARVGRIEEVSPLDLLQLDLEEEGKRPDRFYRGKRSRFDVAER